MSIGGDVLGNFLLRACRISLRKRFWVSGDRVQEYVVNPAGLPTSTISIYAAGEGGGGVWQV
jgi:hypothetical protein